MTLVGIRDRIIQKMGGAFLYENVSSRELANAFSGKVMGISDQETTLKPWSGRIKTRGTSRLLVVLGVMIVSFLSWASVFEIEKVTRGSGRVLPSVQNQVIQHLEGGIVQQILVQEGQRVEKGQILMLVKNQITASDLENARIDVTAKKIMLARMDAEVGGARYFVTPPALAALAPEIARSEEALFASRIQQRGSVDGIANGEANAKRAQLASLNARLANLRSEEALLMVQLGKLERAYQAEAISERDVLDKRSALLSLRTRIADVQNQIPETRAQISSASARQGEVWTRMVQETEEQASRLRLELAKADEAMLAFQDKAQREEIRAPMDGVVNKLFIQTVGGVIRGGEPLAEIVPVDKIIMIEARIAPKDRGEVWEKLPASIKISAYDSAVYGSLTGQVYDVSPDVLQDPRGEPYYRARLRADATNFGNGRPVLPGMTAEVNILSGKQTILDYILGPLIRIKNSALRE